MRQLLFLGLVLLVSCAPYRLKKRSFVYEVNNQNYTLPLLVPAGYNKQEIKYDSTGKKEQLYYYPDGALFYVSHQGKSINPHQQIDREENIPQQIPEGGLIYKGVLPGPLFWREIRIDSFRIGYRNVPREAEIAFDQATNFAARQRLKR